MNTQPTEIIKLFFNNLDQYQLLLITRVCKQWQIIIHNNYFDMTCADVYDCTVNDKILHFHKYIKDLHSVINVAYMYRKEKLSCPLGCLLYYLGCMCKKTKIIKYLSKFKFYHNGFPKYYGVVNHLVQINSTKIISLMLNNKIIPFKIKHTILTIKIEDIKDRCEEWNKPEILAIYNQYVGRLIKN